MLPYTDEAEFPPLPPDVIFLARVGWSWSPMNFRLHSYWAWPDRVRGRVFIWLSDPALEDYFVEHALIAGDLDGDVRQSAARALVDAWRRERREEGLDAFHRIAATGLLSVDDLKAMAAEAWAPDPPDEDDLADPRDDASA